MHRLLLLLLLLLPQCQPQWLPLNVTQNLRVDQRITERSFSARKPQNGTAALRISTTADASDTSWCHVVLRVARQREHAIRSWKLPFDIVEHSNNSSESETMTQHRTVSRTVCPQQLDAQWQNVSVQMNCQQQTLVQLRADLVADFRLSLNSELQLVLTPSEPQFFFFDFADHPDATAVWVSVSSADTGACGLVSVQRSQCPVLQQTDNAERTGYWQTVLGSANIIVPKDEYSSFFVVLMAFPSSRSCGGSSEQALVGGKKLTLKVEQLEDSLKVGVGALAVLVVGLQLVVWLCGLGFLRCLCCETSQCCDCCKTSQCFNRCKTSQCFNRCKTSQCFNRCKTSQCFNRCKTSQCFNCCKESQSCQNCEQCACCFECFKSSWTCCGKVESWFKNPCKWFLLTSEPSEPSEPSQRENCSALVQIITIGIFYCLPSLQLLYKLQGHLHDTGNMDRCFYNFRCRSYKKVLGFVFYTFNSVLSNLGYLTAGVLFLVAVAVQQVCFDRKRKRMEQKKKKPQEESAADATQAAPAAGVSRSYAPFYASGFALIMEGVMSAIYHVCPTHDTFQFDTAFMLMMCGTIMLSLYSRRHPEVNSLTHLVFLSLGVMVFVNSLGILKCAAGYILLAIVLLAAAVGTLRTAIAHCSCRNCCGEDCECPMHCCRWIGCLGNFALPIACFLFFVLCVLGFEKKLPCTFANFVLGTAIGNTAVYFFYCLFLKLRTICKQCKCDENDGQPDKNDGQPDENDGQPDEEDQKTKKDKQNKERNTKITKIVLLVILVLVTIVCFGVALHFFNQAPTDWKESPAQSRKNNSVCLFLGFDVHDLWHAVGSVALLGLLLITLIMDPEADDGKGPNSGKSDKNLGASSQAHSDTAPKAKPLTQGENEQNNDDPDSIVPANSE